ELSARTSSFNADSLKQVAAKAIGAQRCTRLAKTHEGSFNKIFCLDFDNGAEVIAKIPCQLWGPPKLATASEVATMDYARTVLNLSVPKVIAWNSDSACKVGSEYIIMEKAIGTELYHTWRTKTDFKETVRDIIKVDQKFASHRQRKDVSPELQSRPLYAADSEHAGESGSERFRIGPFTDWALWRGTHASVNTFCGPCTWTDMMSYVRSTVEHHQQWIRNYAIPRKTTDPFYTEKDDNLPQSHIELLDRFVAVLPHILPSPELCVSVFWHADLHASNVFVADAPGVPHITSIIDWQNMHVLPTPMQIGHAAFDERIEVSDDKVLPQYPPDLNTLPSSEKASLKVDWAVAGQQKHYELLFVGPPIHEFSRTWFQGLHRLRRSLIQIQTEWEFLAPGVDYPTARFSESEIAAHEEQYQLRMKYEENVAKLEKALELDADGWVSNEKYKKTLKLSEWLRTDWDAEEMGGPYPFQDGGKSWLLLEC
ncbi:kinase-like domain-containing protein, partial [Rhodocollybia butyracea]